MEPDIKLPDKLQEKINANRRGDLVKFKAWKEGGEEIRVNQNCYSAVRPHYKKHRIVCEPYYGKSLSSETYYRYWEILHTQRIVPEGLNIYEASDKLCLEIPAQLASNALIYTTLVAYRWTDAHPGLVYELVELHDRLFPGMSIHRFLTYLLPKYITNFNHSFLGCGWGASDQTFHNPVLGLASQIFFDPDDARNGLQKDDDNYINAHISEMTKKLTPSTTTQGKWGMQESPKFKMKEASDILDSQFDSLYNLEQPNSTQVQECLSQILGEKS